MKLFQKPNREKNIRRKQTAYAYKQSALNLQPATLRVEIGTIPVLLPWRKWPTPLELTEIVCGKSTRPTLPAATRLAGSSRASASSPLIPPLRSLSKPIPVGPFSNMSIFLGFCLFGPQIFDQHTILLCLIPWNIYEMKWVWVVWIGVGFRS